MPVHEKQELTSCELSSLALQSERSHSQKERKSVSEADEEKYFWFYYYYYYYTVHNLRHL